MLGYALRNTIVGNSTPPGRSPGPGQPMPIYQDIPVAPWTGAARGIPNAPNPRTITKHVNMPSNMPVFAHNVVQPWHSGEHNLLREGQITFIARAGSVKKNGEFDKVAKEISMQHLNNICGRGYEMARQDLRDGRIPAVAGSLTLEQFDSIDEKELEEYLGKPDREAQAPETDIILRQALKLLKIGHFKYLRPCSVRQYWNLFGGINNTSTAFVQEAKVQRGNGATLVVNSVVAKKVFLSNMWGDDKKIIEGCKLGLILRRAGGETRQTVGAPEFIPWSDREQEIPALCERSYYDEYNRFQPGHYLPIGNVMEVTGEVPAEVKRREAIGNNNQNPAIVHDAIGTLPQIVVGWGHN